MKLNDVIVAEIDELVTIGEKLSRDASRAGSSLVLERIEELWGHQILELL